MTLLLRRTGRAAVVCAIGVAVLLGPPSSALADPVEARKHFELGKRYFQVNEYRKAIDEFKAAHILEPDPAFLYNLAECHRRLGEDKEALTFYRRFLSLSPPGNPQRAVAEKRVAEIEAAEANPAAAPPAPSSPAVATPAIVGAQPRPPPTIAEPSHMGARSAVTLGASPDAAVAREPAPVEPSRPFYKRGWFYGVVGVVVVGAVVGIIVASSGGGTEIPTTPLGNMRVFD